MENKKTKEKIELSPIDGLVFEDRGFLTPDTGFTHTGDVPQIPRTYLRPMFIGEHGKNISGDVDMSAIAVKSTVAMGKAACVEQPIRIGSIDYNFVLWKGVGENRVNEQGQKKIEAKGGTILFPLGKESAMPLFVAEVDEKLLVRFMGAAYYEDLILEERQSKLMEEYGLRMPKILTTIKFSRQFCIDNNLPIPANDDPEDITGQNPVEHIEANKERIGDPELYKKMSDSYEARDYKSAILGQNVRAFRNVWRVSELEEAMKEKDQEKKKRAVSSILDTSRLILAKEFGEDMSDENFLKTFSKLLGRQVAILLENRINQGAMNNHKQDITLAAEVCDFDGSYQMNEDYLNDEKNQPVWVGGDETRKKEWVKEKERALYRQILLVGAHIKPVVEATGQVGNEASEEIVANDFVDSMVTNLSPKAKKELADFWDTAKNFQDIKDIAGNDLQTQENLAGYQDFFDLIVKKMKEEIERVQRTAEDAKKIEQIREELKK